VALATDRGRPAALGCFERVCRVLDKLAPEDLELIEPHLAAWLRRARRLLARDAAVQALGAYYIGLGSGRAAAEALRKDLARYAASGWRSEAGRLPSGDAKRRLLHRVLSLNNGKTIAAGQIRAILAGLR
jgi:hypothetical protein